MSKTNTVHVMNEEIEILQQRLKTVEERLEALQNSQAERNQGLQPDNSKINEKDDKDKTQLFYAVESRDIVKITMLLKRGADPNIGHINGISPLHEAASSGFTDVCALLLLTGNADINAMTDGGNNTPLHYAAYNGHIDVVDLLLKCGANVNLKCLNGNTAYDDAVQNDYMEIARLLDCAFNRDNFFESTPNK